MGINFNGTNLQELLRKMLGRCHYRQTYNSPPVSFFSPYLPVFSRKIFIGDRPLFLTTRYSGFVAQHPEAADFVHYEGALSKHFRLAIEALENGEAPGAVISDAQPENLLREIEKRYKHVDAAGGLVRNDSGEVLFIFRRGKWDLPKGKLDKGEELDICAVREVQEETGLRRLVLGAHLCDTWHVYAQGGKEYIKRTAWYAMRGSAHETLTPQHDEDIEEVCWAPPAEVARLTRNTFGAIRDVIHCGEKALG